MQNPHDCPICRETGATWCPHEEPVETAPQPPLARPQLASAAAQWTTAQTALLLKVALYLGVGAGAWWLMHSSAERELVQGEPGEADTTTEYSSWEPTQ